jgi:hypothetical protein
VKLSPTATSRRCFLKLKAEYERKQKEELLAKVKTKTCALPECRKTFQIFSSPGRPYSFCCQAHAIEGARRQSVERSRRYRQRKRK